MPYIRRVSRLRIKAWHWLPLLLLSLCLFLVQLQLPIVLLAQAEKTGREAQEKSLIILRNGGCVAGITPQTGGRIVVYRREARPNALDERPELWSEAPPADLSVKPWKQYYGESVWAGPPVGLVELAGALSAGATASKGRPELSSAISRLSSSPLASGSQLGNGGLQGCQPISFRVEMQSPVSSLTGLQLTKTVEVRPDGTLLLQVSAINRGDRVVTRDLWMLTRPPLSVRCFLPLTEVKTDEGFLRIFSMGKSNGLTVVELLANTDASVAKGSGKLLGSGSAGWMATATRDQFFIIHFPLTESAKVPPGCTPIVVFCTTQWSVFELEHHGPLTVLKPGESMTREQTWQIIPNPGLTTAEEQSQFLSTRLH